tara:strand:+ start:1162 stop:2451 length:1290 start_codon:yes stop_codon:yes gene_type:complete
MKIQTTALNKKAEKFYQILQKQYSRKINLDRSRIFSSLVKFNIDPDIDLNGSVLQCIGSDGKNTLLQTILKILIENKKKVTTFTSPAIISPLDRIFIKNKFISLKQFKTAANKIIKSGYKLTLFEVITLIYLLTINKIKDIDYNIVEAGAGFNLDSTNVWKFPTAQLVTNINLQHRDLFGVKTIKDICKIKCGALSHNTNIYIGKQNPKTLKIIKKILDKNPSKKYFYGSDFKIKKKAKYYLYSDKKGTLKLKAQQIYSEGLWENIALGVKVCRDLNIDKKIILKALPKIELVGRLQFIKKGKLRKLLHAKEDLLLDGCHSEASIKNHVNFLKNINKPKYAIWSLMKNRHPSNYAKHLRNFKKIIAIRIPNEPNSCSAQLLKKIAKKQNIECVTAPNIVSAIRSLSSNQPKVISIIGSLYTCGKTLNLN